MPDEVEYTDQQIYAASELIQALNFCRKVGLTLYITNDVLSLYDKNRTEWDPWNSLAVESDIHIEVYEPGNEE